VRAVQWEPVVKAWFRGKLRKKPKPLAQTLVAKELACIAYRDARRHRHSGDWEA
jgi:hypothetical protein